MKKKLTTASKVRGCEDLGPWIKSAVNHLYWCAKSSISSPQEIVPKWASLANHVADIHNHDSDVFPKCLHDDNLDRAWLNDGEKIYSFGTLKACMFPRRKSWFGFTHVTGSDAHRRLCSIVRAPSLLKDIAQLSPKEQTYSCETFHSLLNHYAPKLTAYSYHGMEARQVHSLLWPHHLLYVLIWRFNVAECTLLQCTIMRIAHETRP